jgi:quercetin dioxygenase-like cupin family protein
MTREEFEDTARREGCGEPKLVCFDPSSRSEMHQHDEVSFVFVVEGEFILNTEDGAPRHGPGDTCILPKGVNHAEEVGSDGATILVARK